MRRDEIGQGIEQLDQDMNAITRRFMVCEITFDTRSMSNVTQIQAAALTYRSHAETQVLVRQEREEMKNMLLDIVKNQMGDVRNLASQGDLHGIENLMSGLQSVRLFLSTRETYAVSSPQAYQDDSMPLSKSEASEIGQGLVQIVHETNVLPPIKDLGREVVLTSPQPVTGGQHGMLSHKLQSIHRPSAGVYSDIFVGTWHGEKVAVKGLRHIQATPPAIKVHSDSKPLIDADAS